MKTFRLIGHTTQFDVVRVRWILSGTCKVVDGISVCGGFRTTAREDDIIYL